MHACRTYLKFDNRQWAEPLMMIAISQSHGVKRGPGKAGEERSHDGSLGRLMRAASALGR